MQKRKVLVTGGAGYVGSMLVSNLLSAGYSVRVLDKLTHGGAPLLGAWAHPLFDFVRGDIRDRELVRRSLQRVDAVVHLAAIVGDPACAREPELTKAVNLDASKQLLEDARIAGVDRFIFASTCSNYGKMKDPSQQVDETSELAPVSLYAETKVRIEELVMDPIATDGLCATSLRFATIFGVSPRTRFDLTVNEFTMELITRKRLVVFGEKFWRPYIHVRDAARGIQAVLEAPTHQVRNEVFNVGSTEQNYQKQQIVELILPYVEGGSVEYVHRQEDPRDYRVSFAKIKNALNFEITRTVPDGIAEIARLIRDGVISDLADPRLRN